MEVYSGFVCVHCIGHKKPLTKVIIKTQPTVKVLHDCTVVYICEIVPVFSNAVSVHVHEISVWFPVVVSVQKTGVVFSMVTSTLQCTTHSCVQQSIHCA